MKARIVARIWSGELQAAFGAEGSVHELPDSSEDLFKLLAPHGRFSILLRGEWTRDLTVFFQNDCD